MNFSQRRLFTLTIILSFVFAVIGSPTGSTNGSEHVRRPRAQSTTPQDIQALLAQLNGTRYFNTITALAGFNRYTHSPDILNARDYIQGEFQAVSLPVELQQFTVGSTTAYNVIGTLTGTTRPNEWYIVCGHYDSTSEIPNTSAPGAEDNGSGTAGVLELARVLADEPQEATIKFIAFAGEEQGLFGSNAYVQSLVSSGDLGKVQGVINMDMISFTADNDLDVLLETRSFAQSVLDILQLSAAQFTTLRVVTSFNACCSDHMPFLNNNVKAVLTIENDWNIYPHYHRSTDTPNNITVTMGMEILKMNLATLAQLISGALKSLTVTAPNGGQNWQAGTVQTILWSSTGLIDNVKIEISRDGGTNFELITPSTMNDGAHTWTVTGPPTTTAIIRISDFNDPAVSDVSNNTFTVSDPPPPPPPPPPPGCAVTKLVEGKSDADSTLNLLYRFRNDVLSRTQQGQVYTQQFYRFSPEGVDLLTSNPGLFLRSQEKLAVYKTVIQSIIDTGEATLTQADLNAIDELLLSFAAKGSFPLRQAIGQLRQDLRDPQVLAEFGVRIRP